MKQLTFSDAWESLVQIEDISFSVVVNFPVVPNIEETPISGTMHTHIYYELFFCGMGSITITTDDRVLRLNAGDIALVPIGVRHFLNETVMPAEYEVVGFLCTPISSPLHTGLYKTLRSLLHLKDIAVYRHHTIHFDQIQKITHRHVDSSQPGCYPALQMLMILLELVSIKPEQEDNAQTKQPTASLHPNDIQRINILEQLIAHNYMQPVRIDDFADKLHIGIRQLARIVEKHYGKSLHRVIVDKRLEMAENLLLHSDLTIEKIAISVGFNSKVSFYREFTRKHQMTPAQFREYAECKS